MRLIAQKPEVVDVRNNRSFVAPTAIGAWRAYLHDIRPSALPRRRLPQLLLSNIAHRLQALEFTAALLLYDLSLSRLQGNGRSLPVARFQIHQYCVVAHSILKGIGSHIVRANGEAKGERPDVGRKIAARIWRPALAREASDIGDFDTDEVRDRLADISELRDRIHLDRFDPDGDADFNDLGYADSFAPTYETFRMVLTALNPNWPRGCCMNEELNRL